MKDKLLRPLAMFLFVLSLGCFAGVAHAQTGTITGSVIDSELNEPLPGANILVAELERGAATNLDGEFTIENIPYGDYTLVITYIGYSTIRYSVTIDSELTEQDFLKHQKTYT